MKQAIKRVTRLQAWQLGKDTPMERRLIAEGRIVPRKDGKYELFSQEATGDRGQLARAGDYFKVDATGNPYPNEREKFEQTHRHIEDDWYEQIPRPLSVWMADDPDCEETRFLLQTGRLRVHADTPERYFSAWLWGTEETAPRDAVVVFYDVKRDPDGAIEDIEFNFVVRGEFERTYELL